MRVQPFHAGETDDVVRLRHQSLPGVTDEVVIYSIVNSLAEISGVSKVQFMVNGEVQKKYRENIPFDGLFERNLDLVTD